MRPARGPVAARSAGGWSSRSLPQPPLEPVELALQLGLEQVTEGGVEVPDRSDLLEPPVPVDAEQGVEVDGEPGHLQRPRRGQQADAGFLRFWSVSRAVSELGRTDLHPGAPGLFSRA